MLKGEKGAGLGKWTSSTFPTTALDVRTPRLFVSILASNVSPMTGINALSWTSCSISSLFFYFVLCSYHLEVQWKFIIDDHPNWTRVQVNESSFSLILAHWRLPTLYSSFLKFLLWIPRVSFTTVWKRLLTILQIQILCKCCKIVHSHLFNCRQIFNRTVSPLASSWQGLDLSGSILSHTITSSGSPSVSHQQADPW